MRPPSRSAIASSSASTPATAPGRARPAPASVAAPPPSSSAPAIAASAPDARRRAGPRRGAGARAQPPSSRSSAGSGAAASISASSKRNRSRSRSRAPSRSRSSASSRASRRHCAVRLAVALAPLEVLSAREAVEDLELRRGERQLAVLVLSVEGEQPGAERPQVARPTRSACTKALVRPRGRDPAAEHDLVGALGQAARRARPARDRRAAPPAGRRRPRPRPPRRQGGRSAAAPCRPSAGRASGRAPSSPPRSRR